MTRLLNIRPPLAGLNRKKSFSEAPPFSTPACQNVRPFSSFTRRQMVGSRPGLTKASYTVLGAPSKINLLAEPEFIQSDTRAVITDPFNEISGQMGGDWEQIATGIPSIADGRVYVPSTVATKRGATRAAPSGSDLVTGHATGAVFRIGLYLSPYQAAWAGDYFLSFGLDNSLPDVTLNGVEVRLRMNSGTSYSVQCTQVSAGAVQVTTGTSSTASVKPGWFELLITPGATPNVKAYWHDTEVLNQNISFANLAGTKTGFAMTRTVSGGQTQAEHWRMQYAKSTSTEYTRRLLIAACNGTLYRQVATNLNEMQSVSSSATLASDRQLMSASRVQKEYIADNNSVIRRTDTVGSLTSLGATISSITLTGNVVTVTCAAAHKMVEGHPVEIILTTPDAVYDGTYIIASTPTSTTFTYPKINADRADGGAGSAQVPYVKLTVTSGSNDWTQYGIEVAGDMIDITSTSTFNSNNRKILQDGTYDIASVSSTELILNRPAGWKSSGIFGTVSPITFTIRKAPKVYDPVANTLTAWKPDTITLPTIPKITTIALTGNVVTVTTDGPHGLGDYYIPPVKITLDTANAVYDGIYNVIYPVPSPTTFTYAKTNGNIGSAAVTGSVTLADYVNKKGSIPLGNPGVTVYRDRMVLFGYNHQVYFSRQGDPNDFDFSEDASDAQRAFVLTLSNASGLGKRVTACIPVNDDYMVMACADSLWLLRGDPTFGGQLDALSRTVGIIDKSAWCRTPDGHLVFLSQDGLYGLPPGATMPQPISPERLPKEFLAIDTQNITIAMGWSIDFRGIEIKLSAPSSSSVHWFFDWETKSFWPDTHGSGLDAFSMCYHTSRDPFDSGLLIGCRDGYIRRARDICETDDGTSIDAQCTYGPMWIGKDRNREGLISELQGTLASGSGSVNAILYNGNSEEEAYSNSTAFESLVWASGRNAVDYVRMRTGAMKLKVSASSGRAWAVEEIHGKVLDAGVLRPL